MSTTTIRIPDELKARVAAVAEQVGVTSHSFILQAIAEKTQQEELRRDFENEAEKRYAKIIATERRSLGKRCAVIWKITQRVILPLSNLRLKNWGADGKCRVGARGQG
ncbi:CopG family ribbon-helix-helix protein [Serratia ureilytica]